MSAPAPSQKDAEQVLRYAFDDATGELRTSASVGSVILDQTTSSVAIGDGTTTFTGTTVDGHHSQDINIESNQVALFSIPYDAVTVTYPLTTQEVYQSRIGGIAGVVQQTVTINYTDATKAFILNAART